MATSVPTFVRNRALDLLRAGVGDPLAGFRPGQEEAIEHVVTGAGRLLVVQKTGWGKSFVYFIATKMLREAAMGPALMVSPLLALMRNQIAAAERMGVKAETINSDNPDHWHGIEAALRRNEVDILLIAPERLANDRFRNGILADIADRIALLVIDEAHCISDWGHDFPPHYRLIERTIRYEETDITGYFIRRRFLLARTCRKSSRHWIRNPTDCRPVESKLVSTPAWGASKRPCSCFRWNPRRRSSRKGRSGN